MFMKDAGVDQEKKEQKTTKDYLRKMPRGIKRELTVNLLHELQAGIRQGVDVSFNPENY